MRARLLGILLVLLAGAAAARAQLGIYAKFDYVNYSEASSASSGFEGGGVGIYDDFIHAGPVSLGLDFRGDLGTQSKSNYRTLLGGVRVAAKLPLNGFAALRAGVDRRGRDGGQGTVCRGDHGSFVQQQADVPRLRGSGCAGAAALLTGA